jgi:hypothetical protein
VFSVNAQMESKRDGCASSVRWNPDDGRMKVFPNGTGNPIPNLAPFRTGLSSNSSRVRAFLPQRKCADELFHVCPAGYGK